ncbi:hypothetical protein [Actinocorallia libanotica]
MTSEDLHAAVEELLALPFPREDTRGEVRDSGPGYHVQVLQASRDFWDDRDEEIVEAAEEEIDAAFRALATALTARWGEPETVDLDPYLWSEEPAPEPLGRLSMLSGRMLVWRRPVPGRWVALAVGQADREFPIELLAAIGEEHHLPA